MVSTIYFFLNIQTDTLIQAFSPPIKGSHDDQARHLSNLIVYTIYSLSHTSINVDGKLKDQIGDPRTLYFSAHEPKVYYFCMNFSNASLNFKFFFV